MLDQRRDLARRIDTKRKITPDTFLNQVVEQARGSRYTTLERPVPASQPAGLRLRASHSPAFGERRDFHRATRVAGQGVLAGIGVPFATLVHSEGPADRVREAGTTARHQREPVGLLVAPGVMIPRARGKAGPWGSRTSRKASPASWPNRTQHRQYHADQVISRSMLTGEKVVLRTITDDDRPPLHLLQEDPETTASATQQAWTPQTWEDVKARRAKQGESLALFAVASREDGTLLGEAVLSGIDNHNRVAAIGLGLLPEARGNGYGLDTVRVLCDYGFRLRGLHRIWLDTLATNHAMIKTAEKTGFQLEGTLRSQAWIAGEFVDALIFGQLAEEWFRS